MGISGCTSCQLGGVEALKAYDRAYQAKLNQEAADGARNPPPRQASEIQANSENRPIAGATVGSNINISV